MLTDILFALCDHLRTLEVPFYLADCVPKGAALPYLTADIQLPLHPGMEGALTLTYWCTGEKSSYHRLNQANRIESAFPHRGLWLNTDAGVILLTHKAGMECITQQEARGVVFRFKLQIFPNS